MERNSFPLETPEHVVEFDPNKYDPKPSQNNTSLVTSITSHWHRHSFRTIQCSVCGDYRTISTDCGDRFCRRCGFKRAKRISHRYGPRINKFQQPKLLTLTKRRVPLSADSVKQLREDFTALRQSPVWRATSGLYAIEVGTADEIGMVNLHIHAIIDSDFMRQGDLSAEWRRITGDSFIVDIRRCWSQYGAIHYLQQYVTKVPEDSPKWFKDRFNAVFQNTRLIQSFGDFRLIEAPAPVSTCLSCGAIGSMVCVDYDASLEGLSPRGPPIQIADAIRRCAS